MASASEALTREPLSPPGDADYVREAIGFALLCARRSGSDPQKSALGVPRVLSAVDVRALPREELREGLDAVLLSRRADVGLLALHECGLLQVILPEVTALVGYGEGDSRHKDVWRHTLQVVIQSVPRIAVRWGALFHDIGKPKTRSVDADGTVHFLHHAEVGARMFSKIAKREKLFPDEEECEKIRFLVYHHQRAHQYDDGWTDSATRRFAREIGDHMDDLMALSRADMTTKRKEKRRRFLFQLKTLCDRIERLQAEDSKPKPLPKGLGDAIISEFQLPPSKLVGDIRKALVEAVEAGELPLQAPFDVYLDFIRSQPDRFPLPEGAGRTAVAPNRDADAPDD